MNPERVTTVDAYLANVPSDADRAALERLRAIIREEVPDAEEVISYGMPGFKLRSPFIWFAAFKNHCSLFAGGTTASFAQDLVGYKISKGTIQFTPNHPLPESLVRTIVRTRVAEIEAKKPKKRQAV